MTRPAVPTRLRARACAWLLLGGLLTVFLGGCSSTKFAYNRLDFFLPWYLGRYVDLDGDQADWFDTRIDNLLAWHRADELPRYVIFLERLENALGRPVTLTGVQDWTDTLELAWYRLRDPGLEELLALGERLTEQQVEEFIATLRKRQGKYEKKYLDRSDEEFRDDATEDLSDLFEDYLGRLSPQQDERVRGAADALARTDSEWLDERAAWIDEMERLLRREPGWQAEIRHTIRNWEAQLDESTLAVYDRNTRVVQELVVDVLNSRTERQSERLLRRLGDLREDFSDLHGQPSDARGAR